MDVRPSPELAVAISTVVALHPIRQGLALKSLCIESNLTGKNRVRMRRARKSNPALAAQLDAKRGAISQIPADPLAIHFQPPATLIFADSILARLKDQRALPSCAQTQVVKPKSLNPCLRLSRPREPRCPHLSRLPTRITSTFSASGIHQQIPKPPRPAAVRKPQPQEPNFIPPPHRQFRKGFIERFHLASTKRSLQRMQQYREFQATTD